MDSRDLVMQKLWTLVMQKLVVIMRNARSMMSKLYDEQLMTALKKPRRSIPQKTLQVFDHQIHQKLATDVIVVSFDAE